MKHIIIGTAGHVDHGKTALIKSLTGVDTDRLKEEKERGISIELGFTQLTLPSGKKAGIVDVPGHERFIKNMLAGVGGIDLVLLVIAADEGVMPQTREHLDILQLLQVKQGIVVLTKVDLVDEEWLGLVTEEVKEFLKGTVLEKAPVVPVSSVTGEGLPELLKLIDKAVDDTEEKISTGKLRLPIDRVFSVTGFGTVVTGTLLSGKISLGDTVQIMPQGLLSRVRSLQVHGQKVEQARAGQRTAVNLTGVEVDQVKRGNVLATPNSLTPSHRLDVKLLLLESVSKSLSNRERVRVYLGTDEILGRVRLLDREELEPGQEVFAQLEMEEQVVAGKGDRFVIRSYSPMRTIGGGTVIDPNAPKHKRFRPEVLAALATKEQGTPDELIDQFLTGKQGLFTLEELAAATGLPGTEVDQAIKDLADKVKVIPTDKEDLFVASQVYRQWGLEVQKMAENYHREFPLREGYPKEEMRSRKFAFVSSKNFLYLLQALQKDGYIVVFEKTMASPTFKSQLSAAQQKQVDALVKAMMDGNLQPPSWNELVKKMKLKDTEAQEYLQYLLRRGDLVKIGDDLYLAAERFKQGRRLIVDFLKEHQEISVAQTRDLLQTSRKFALPLLEYLDRERVTRRVGDNRVLGAEAAKIS
ncbi:selenocysteine-specific translation elongation factor [Desulfotomaculum nigrificans CO-1-SRB]|uniref:Selenocysteine-specific elongation factor n=1 Tax=Desulfotomaculum nigrificans (strain DSM 14880 / VKM B-2319 / CO-1-SRB) TaxID=868595 RepID=F6B705_DESCC|nr:selenocysteine-specific translation elongation factor [Desulfotomaculum nigrificans]AEF94430.1 selenocysteine-specific translation elongation factor [Desulfotomaculum nigrificans CO-1-SRB]